MHNRAFLILLNSWIMLMSDCSVEAQKDTFNWGDTTFTHGTKRMVQIIMPIEGATPENTEYRNKEIFDTIDFFLKRNPKLSIKISVHSATLGPENFNLKLTQEHAKNIKSVLVKRGISEKRILSEGYGESQPIIPENEIVKQPENKRAELDIKNIRIELVILSDKQ